MNTQSDVAGLAPEKVAVVLVDFQNGFCHEDADASDNKVSNRKAALRANAFAATASRLGAYIVYTKQILDPEHPTPRQCEWAIPENICPKGSRESELYIEPIPGSTIVTKYRFDIWQSDEFLRFMDRTDPEGLVIEGVELCCCALFAVLGADERGYRVSVPMDLVSGIDDRNETYNRYIRDYFKRIYGAPDTSDEILKAWQFM
jgi:nicotinamidase-related amidase